MLNRNLACYRKACVTNSTFNYENIHSKEKRLNKTFNINLSRKNSFNITSDYTDTQTELRILFNVQNQGT